MKLKSVILAAAMLATGQARADVSLHQGRYVGWIDPGNGDKKIGLVMDLYVVKPNDPDQFQVLNALLRLNLGGLQTAEYETELYESIQYDFTDGVISMGGVNNDIAITGKVSSNDAAQSIIDGQAFVRSAALSAKVRLIEVSDDPDADPGTLPGDQYKPLLGGQYDGTCGNDQVVVQIELARSLGATPADKHGLASYVVHGRLGTYDNIITPGGRQFYAMRNFTSATFDLFKNRLILEASNGSDECKVSGTGMTCTVHLGVSTQQCDLTREALPVLKPVFYGRAEHVATAPAQMAKLPAPNPPANTDLINALQGDFIGYLHHEGNNHYQVMRLSVMAYSSTDNPHNPNLVYVSGATVLHFGPSVSDDFYVQQFEPRSFLIVPGFTLESATSDAFLHVIDWRQGFLRGVVYSRAFGRVGTFEMAKGTTLPPIGASAKFVPSIIGDYRGPRDMGGGNANRWWFNLLVPTQVPRPDQNALALQGQFQLADGGTPRISIEHGAYDFYSGGFGWETSEGRLVTGKVGDGPALQLFWPGAPIYDVLMETDHGFYSYTH